METLAEKIKNQIEEAIAVIRQKTKLKPEIGIILGTGLGGLAKEIEVECSVKYFEIPHFPHSTGSSHNGQLIFGTIAGKPVVAMQGRFHFYEGYNLKQVTFPVRVMKYLGIKTLLISNACGSVNPIIKKGDLMIIEDHINLLGDNPLIGINDDSLGVRILDMSEPYSRRLSDIVEKIALDNKIIVHKGVYAIMSGPSLETKAEYRMLRIIGADAIGMSTVPETIVAHQMEIEVLGLSIITDECIPEILRPLSIEEIVETASKAEPKLTFLMKELIKEL